MNNTEMFKPKKIFISHSSLDKSFVKPLVELFGHIGISQEKIFCSSLSGYNVPLGVNIFNYLKEQFQKYDLMVIFVLSENYYNSVPCLNEMGAAWVLQHEYRCILLPQFDYKDVEGVIAQMEISIKLDSEKFDLKGRLNELRETLMKEFDLKNSVALQNTWEEYRDEYIEKVRSAELYWKQIRQLKENNKPWKEWILPLQKLLKVNWTDYDAMYALGVVYANMNDVENAVRYLTTVVRDSKNEELKVAARKCLAEIGHII